MIKFPKVHIAESVVNRILNVRDALESSPDSGASAPGAAVELPPAVVPDPAPQGAGIEEAIAQTPAAPPMGEPGSDTAQAVGSVLQGDSALQGFINARTQPQ